jgi:methyl-accepting chemotaxis protein
MSIRKKILATSIGPVLVLGVITLLFMLTMVKSSLMDEVQDALKGTAAATLAAYDQNTGDYLESTNGDIWEATTYPNRKIWWIGSKRIPEWM